MYYAGNGVKQNYDEAIKWFQKAAEQGDEKARKTVKFLTFINNPKYIELKAEAEKGNAEAQYKFALLHGQNFYLDEEVKWYKKAAEQGHIRAQEKMGYEYESGLNVQQDNAEAVKWYKMAAEQGSETARAKLKEFEKSIAAANTQTTNTDTQLQSLNNTKWWEAYKEDLPKIKTNDDFYKVLESVNDYSILSFYADKVNVFDYNTLKIVGSPSYSYNSQTQSGSFWYNNRKSYNFKISKFGIFYKMIVSKFYDDERDAIFLKENK